MSLFQYKVPQIDISNLVEQYPQLSQYVKEGTFDFSLSLSQYDVGELILKHYFDVDVNFERSKLCPRIPNRLEYIRICEQLTGDFVFKGNWIIDIGTGSSAIYPLLATKLNPNNSCVGTEIEIDSISHAQKIIDANSLDSRIKLLTTDAKLFPVDEIFAVLGLEPVKYTVCNPPFYKNKQDYKARESHKKQKLNELNYRNSEMFTPGGELAFVGRIIDESILLFSLPNFQNTWFTVQLGIFSNAKDTVNKLRDLYNKNIIGSFFIEEINFTTKRWVVAWNRALWHPMPLKLINSSLNKREIVNVYVKVDSSKIKEILSSLRVTHTKLKFEIIEKESLYLIVNEPVWSRHTKRALKFNPDKLYYNNDMIVRFSRGYAALLLGLHEHYTSLINYITTQISTSR